MADIATLRLANTLALFDEFVAVTVAQAAAGDVRGLERLFAERLRISPSYWSQLKSRQRQIGAKLARQFEALSGKGQGWLDEAHATPAGPDPSADADERFATEVFLAAYRFNPRAVKERLLAFLQAELAPPQTRSATAKIQAPRTLTTIK
jgi:hypothetical protein